MRVLQFNHFGTYVGGVEGYIGDVSSALATAGHQTRLISFASESPGDLMAKTVQVNSSEVKTALAGIERVIADFRPDVAYLHAVYDPEIVRWIVARLPAIAYVHSPYLVCPGYALFLPRSTRVCGRTAGLACLVNAQIEHCCFGQNPVRHIQRLRQVRRFLEVYSLAELLVGGTSMRHRLIANGLKAEKVGLLSPVLFTKSPPDYVTPADPAVILFAGRITLEKGLRNLLQTLASVGGDWRLIVAGDGPDRDACQQLADQLDIAERVEFSGRVTPTEMRILYQRCAFVAVPSLWPEPYGRVGPEAFFHSRPVVAYAVGGIPDWLEDGETGYLAIPGDVDSLREAIERMIENPGEREYLGRTARDRSIVRWMAGAHIQRLVASFRAAIDAFGNAGSGG